jgi:GT2 family glycosyltransferase
MEMTPPPFVLIVTVNYNGGNNTLETLASLAQMSYPRFEVLLVDNGSSDDSLATIRRAFPALSVLANKTNVGFAGGFNLGLQQGIVRGADLILVVNNDIVVAPDMLDFLVEAWSPGVGAIAPYIYYYDQPDVIWSSGFRRHPITLEMVGGQRNRMARVAPQIVPFPVDYLLGCALLLDREALVASGLFDPRFYLYYEDLDLSVRLQQRGYRLLTVPAAQMWHKVAGSSGLDSPLRTYHLARSSVLFFRKHGGGWRAPFVLADRTGSAIRKVGTEMCRGDTKTVRAYLHGIRDGWRGICNDTPYR